MRIIKTERTERQDTDKGCGKSVGAAAAALGAWLLVSGLAGSACVKGQEAPKKKQAMFSKATTMHRVNPGSSAGCGVEWTKEELDSVVRELVNKCRSVGQGDLLREGSTVTTISGKMAKVIRVDKQGALWAFGEQDPEKGNGKFVVATYVPFDSKGYATTFTIMDPALMEGKESEKVKGLNDDVMVVVCPSKDQTTSTKMLKIVKRTWGELRCRIAATRQQEKDKMLLESLVAKIKSIKLELGKTTDYVKMGQLGKELSEASEQLRQITERDKGRTKTDAVSKPGQT